MWKAGSSSAAGSYDGGAWLPVGGDGIFSCRGVFLREHKCISFFLSNDNGCLCGYLYGGSLDVFLG